MTMSDLRKQLIRLAYERPEHREKILPLIREAAVSDEEKMKILRRIVDRSQAEEIDGVFVDLFSASAIVQVYDALNSGNQRKYIKLPVGRMAEIAFKMGKRASYDPHAAASYFTEYTLPKLFGSAENLRKLSKNRRTDLSTMRDALEDHAQITRSMVNEVGQIMSKSRLAGRSASSKWDNLEPFRTMMQQAARKLQSGVDEVHVSKMFEPALTLIKNVGGALVVLEVEVPPQDVDGKLMITMEGFYTELGTGTDSVIYAKRSKKVPLSLLDASVFERMAKSAWKKVMANAPRSAYRKAAFLQIGQGGENDKIRYHLYRGSLKVTDLENAGKRGETVKILSIGFNHKDMSSELYDLIEALPRADYAKVKKMAEKVIETAPDGIWYTLDERTEKGVRVTPAGFEPVEIVGENVYVKAGYDDFVVKCREDRANEPTCIPALRGGKKDIKVFYRWVKDNEAKIRKMQFHDVTKSMSKEGISFHQYCAVD